MYFSFVSTYVDDHYYDYDDFIIISINIISIVISFLFLWAPMLFIIIIIIIIIVTMSTYVVFFTYYDYLVYRVYV